jgi:uroporphyrinogen-III synthase
MLVALTRELGHNEELRDWVGDRAEMVEIPLTKTRFRAVQEVADELGAAARSSSFHSLILTSARGERYLGLARSAVDDDAEVFSVGPSTSEVLTRSGWLVTHEAPRRALDLAPLVSLGPVLILGAVAGREELPHALRERGLETVVIECYETVAEPLEQEDIDVLRRADVIFVGAPSAWRVVRDVISDGAWVLVPGETTRDEVRPTHSRVLIGWGRDFDVAWDHIAESAR